MSDQSIFSRYRLFIFDADETLRRTTVAGQPCPRQADQWLLLPGVRQRLSGVSWNHGDGPYLGIASNQDQVGYGHLSFATARQLLRDLAKSAAGVHLPDAALQLCPHRLEVSCGCRKPEPGMLRAIMDYYQVPPSETAFVGNDEPDREAAARAGTDFIWAADFFGMDEPSAQVQLS
jgi:D-glycero-D-manno-heptose 1,7-bisphosphate phosphatase